MHTVSKQAARNQSSPVVLIRCMIRLSIWSKEGEGTSGLAAASSLVRQYFLRESPGTYGRFGGMIVGSESAV
jgi:hypothetical protein